jgi:hypothetical protein
MKVFISHQQSDSQLALGVARRLKVVHDIDSYLDLIDPGVGSNGDDLADHVRGELGKCTQLLAVVSEATRTSWWVPWEIGIASEKDFPLATFASGTTALPDYLKKWPYLRTDADLDRYAEASKTAAREFVSKRGYLQESVARGRSTKEFFRVLRAGLGQ